ncbi:MAG: hypothetical protein QOH42_1619, partial [Blastocatellia bacterium]|nr:hypothetical protein [Blastocatellia bacterium]
FSKEFALRAQADRMSALPTAPGSVTVYARAQAFSLHSKLNRHGNNKTEKKQCGSLYPSLKNETLTPSALA